MPNIKKVKAYIKNFINKFENIYTLELIPETKVKFFPGQFLHLAIDDFDGNQWPESRCFSMQNSPDENIIKITFSVVGNFTKRLTQEIPTKEFVWIKLPYGDMFLRKHEKNNCVFISGGTGVTPFLSLFRSNRFSEYSNAKIYAGFRSKLHNIFDDDWELIFEKKSPTQCIFFCYEDIDGMLNIENIYRSNIHANTFFISGPPKMIKEFKNYLLEQNIESNKIITDDWE